MTTGPVCRTLILGSGFAGALAARACAAASHHVTVVEKDESLVGPRPGAPQADQLHNVLSRAQHHLADLVPNAVARFDAAGGVRAPVSTATRVFELGRLMPERDIGLELWSAPKHVIDSVAHDGLGGLVDVRLGTRAEGLLVEDGRICGATLGGGERMEADLVVDALGARSPLPRWLGRQRPGVQQLQVRQWYTTMTIRLNASETERFWLTFPSWPATRGGLASPLGDGTWKVSLSGGPDDTPPLTAAAFSAYALSLEDPGLGRLVEAGTPFGPPRTFHKPIARWRRYDRATRLPQGLVSIGDAVADLNPLFGQGLSLAAWQAGELASLVKGGTPTDQIGPAFAERAARAVCAAWDLMTVFDNEVSPVPATAWERIAEAVKTDPASHRRYVEVWHLLQPVATLGELAVPAQTGVLP